MTCSRVELVEKYARKLNFHLSDIRYNLMCDLWAGYGSLYEVTLDKSGSSTIVCKEIAPSIDDSVSHRRKMRSYMVEAALYQQFSSELRKILPMAELLAVECNNNGQVVLLLSDLRNEFPNKVQKLNLSPEEIRVALDWLVKYHTFFWTSDSEKTSMLWPEGGYWYFATRQEEYANISKSWRVLHHLAPIISDFILQCKHQTIIHGDYKCPNILYSRDRRRCAAVDFQYTGRSLCTRDIVMLLASSSNFDTYSHEQQLDAEEEYLTYYYASLSPEIQSRFSRLHLQQQYELALLDYARFMAGWGWWGNVQYVQNRVKTLIDSLKNAQCIVLQKSEVVIDDLDVRSLRLVFDELC